jgi:hypothetical protein
LLDGEQREASLRLGEHLITARHVYTYGWSPRAHDGSPWPPAAALVIQLAADEYLVAGTAIALSFDLVNANRDADTNAEGNNNATASISIGFASIDLVNISERTITPIRRLNGDQSHQGRHARIEVGDWSILHLKLYRYR